MRAGQFVVLWMAALALGLVLLAASNSYSAGLAILILAGTAIYSLGDRHPRAEQRRAIALTGIWLGVLVSAIGLVVGGRAWLDRRESSANTDNRDIPLSPGIVNVIRAVVSNEETTSGAPTGTYFIHMRVRNASAVEVSRVVFAVTIRDTTGVLAQGPCDLEFPSSDDVPSESSDRDPWPDLLRSLAIPPGQVRDGVLQIKGAAPASKWEASYHVKEVWGQPKSETP